MNSQKVLEPVNWVMQLQHTKSKMVEASFCKS